MSGKLQAMKNAQANYNPQSDRQAVAGDGWVYDRNPFEDTDAPGAIEPPESLGFRLRRAGFACAGFAAAIVAGFRHKSR